MKETPIVYEGLVDVRISDLDMYGHVNSKHYLDFVSTVRLNYMADVMKISVEEVAKKGIGFYMTRSLVNYRKPIVGLQKVLAKSHVSEVRDGSTLIIPFSISTIDEEKVFADGVLDFALVDMKTKRTTPAPDWIVRLFFLCD